MRSCSKGRIVVAGDLHEPEGFTARDARQVMNCPESVVEVSLMETTLPRSLTLSGRPFDRTSKIWNVVDGELPGVRIVVLDCRLGIGKSNWSAA
jgi:hypothetical protein